MLKKSILTKSLVALSLLCQHAAWAQTEKKVERPPQYVAFAFDGSYNNEVWEYSRDFAKQQNEMNKNETHFTFFINPVYLLTREIGNKFYKAPGGNRGSSIGWGDDVVDISTRVDNMNDAYLEGHEIGSHTVGHFNGSKWSKDDWTAEFSQFNAILDNLFSLNKIRRSVGLLFQKDIIGFRAPQLGVSEGLWPTLKRFGFKYDTSKVSTETYWPKKSNEEIWNFPLAEIEEPGTSKKWISMDYNFCVRDSSRVLAKDQSVMKLSSYDVKRKKVVKNTGKDCLAVVSEQDKQAVKANMLKLYHSYFNKNYYGNRAPLHIGHHFASWMSGAYREAFFEFANEVCKKPDVKCGTYTELMNFLDSKSPAEIAAYQKGNFVKLARPKALSNERHWDLSVNLSRKNDALKFEFSGFDAKRPGLTKEVSVEGVTKNIKDEMQLADIREVVKTGETALIRLAVHDRMGNEVSTATYEIHQVGTEMESVNFENIETRWMEGHLPGAHADEVDFTQGH